jgi:lyso-ornithine lipid O-acyltransferase
MSIRGFSDRIRGVGRLAAVAAWMACSAVRYGVSGMHRRDLAAKAEWLSGTSRKLLGALGVRIVSSGVASRGSVIVANHLSYIDIMVLSALTPVVFVAKREVRGWPVFGWFAAKAGTRFIDREKRADVARIGDELAPVMAAGVSIVLFLEGTTSDGREVLPFRASLLAPAIAAGWRLLPVGLSYAVPPGRSATNEVGWWGDMTLGPHLVNLASLPWIEARVAWGRAEPAAGDRKILAAELREEVSRLRNSAWPKPACGGDAAMRAST